MSNNSNKTATNFSLPGNTSLKKEFTSYRERFCKGMIDRYDYISRRHEFNKLLLSYSDEIKQTDIEYIKILPNKVIFCFSPLHIRLETDGAARSAPFEVLNFGSYEPEDENIVYQLIQNENTILDIGANIGWFSINFALRFPKSHIYSFEPIKSTFKTLNNNIELNDIKNVTILNYGISNKDEEVFLYYFRGGSAIASVENLIDHKKAQKVKCRMKTIDQIVLDFNLKYVDFIKCDVEGSELFSLQGGRDTLRLFKPIIFIELVEEWCKKCGYHSSDIINMLTPLGYKLFQAVGNKLQEIHSVRSEDIGRYNYFFLHAEKHLEIIDRFL